MRYPMMELLSESSLQTIMALPERFRGDHRARKIARHADRTLRNRRRISTDKNAPLRSRQHG